MAMSTTLAGLRFLAALTTEIAGHIGAGELTDDQQQRSLGEYAAPPQAHLAVTDPGFAEFVQHIWHETERHDLAAMNPVNVQSALAAVLRARFEAHDRHAAMEKNERIRTWMLAAQKFESTYANTVNPPLLRIAAESLSELVHDTEPRNDIMRALGFARRFAKVMNIHCSGTNFLLAVWIRPQYYLAPVRVLLAGDANDVEKAGFLARRAFQHVPWDDKLDDATKREMSLVFRIARDAAHYQRRV